MTHDSSEKLCPVKTCNCWGFALGKPHHDGCPSLRCQCALIKAARQEGRDETLRLIDALMQTHELGEAT